MTGRRRELADSFRLLATDERWVATDLLLGVVAAAAWVAATGALGLRAAGRLGYPAPVGPDGTWTALSLGAAALLWAVVPAVAVTYRLRTRVLNIRGNVERHYRVDRPAALLAPPALALLAVAGAALALGTVPIALLAVAIPATLFLLARTLAYCYRVFAVSRPLVLQGAVAAALAVQAACLLGSLAVATGRRQLAAGALAAAGLPERLLGSVGVAWLDVPVLPALAVAAPVAVAVAYLAVQTAGALVVRAVEPTVDRSSMRSGQRYPPFLDVASGSTDPTDAQTPLVDGADDAGDEDEPGDDLDDVSNTRVFTPPAGDDGDGFGAAAGLADDGGGVRTDGATAAAGGEGEGTRRCENCGETVTADPTARFCPNCGTALAD